MKRKQAKQNKQSSTKNISSSTKLPAINNKKSLSTIPQNVNINVSSYQDEGLITLIQEYLLKNNLFDTLEIFQKDCLKGFKQSAKSVDTLKKELIEAFDSGNRDVFLIKFTQFVPLSMRTKDTKTLKMQFYIQLYFFIYSIHPYLGKKKNIQTVAKQNFIGYLEGRGASLSKQEQFLPFYALAYLQKPQEHQTFKSMFTKQWIQDIRKELVVYIDKLYPPSKSPTIVSIYDKFIEYNLQNEKFSSVALTEPDEEYDEHPIEEQIQENLQESILNNPQPVLLENNNSNRVVNNNSVEKFQLINQQVNNSINGNTMKSIHGINEKDHETIVALNERINELEEERDRLLSFIENSKNKYQNLENDFKEFSESIKNILQESQNKWFKIIQQLYNVATDLLNAATALEKGLPLFDAQLIAKRGQKLERYKGFVNMNIEDLLSDNVADYSLFQKPEHDLSVDMVKKNTEYFERDQKFIEIDFEKVKNVLGTIPHKDASQQEIKELYLQKCLILQALRWRMTRIRGAFQKREVVLSYTTYDVLGITEGKQKGNSIINILLNTEHEMILLETTLFISALCKDYYGREYLFDEKLMVRMMNLRKKPEIDERIKGIILVIFQLQSNKRSCQSVMIDNGLIEEIVDKLDKQRDQMSTFIMEYATALLLNLLLSKKGLDRAEAIKSQILMTLINLMQTENTSVKSFVHASLYPLLARKVFREKALEFGMEENIKYLLENSPSVQFQHQLKYVYDRLMMQNDEEEDKDEEPEYDEINDEEIGQDIQFIVEEISSSLSGQFLLMKKYALTGPDAMKQMSHIKDQVRVTFSKAIYYDREVTERLSVQTPLLGKGRKSQIQYQEKGFTHNYSVYSNKSSNRILRSQKNSRIKNQNNHKSSQKQRLDTVNQHGSESSLKEYRQHSKGQSRNPKNIVPQTLQNNSFQKSKIPNLPKNDKILQIENAQGTFRQAFREDSPLKGSLIKDFDQRPIVINQNAKIINSGQMPIVTSLNNQSFEERLKIQNAEQANIRNMKLKPYEHNEEYINAFQTRARVVRTPPQKPT